jgi:uncharacterized OsmC-like protein
MPDEDLREILERNARAVGIGEKSGGTNAGPSPGVLGPALGSCLAVGSAMRAARLGVQIDTLEVRVEADYDSRGELDVSDSVPPGYTQVRYHVKVSSPAPEADVRRVIDTADRYSPYRDVFARAHDVRRELTIEATTGRPRGRGAGRSPI